MFNTLNITVTHAVYITQVEHKNRAIIFSMDNAASTIETAAFLEPRLLRAHARAVRFCHGRIRTRCDALKARGLIRQ